MFNKVTLVGRLGQAPTFRLTQTQQALAVLTLATTEYAKDARGHASSHTEWHRVVAFGALAETLRERGLTSGALVFIEGRIHTRKWQDTQQREHSRMEIIADTFRYLSSPATQVAAGQDSEAYQSDDALAF